MSTHTTAYARGSDALDWVRAMLGVLGIFAALGVAAALLAFSASNALKGANLLDSDQAPLLFAASLVGFLPLVAGPILASIGGLWSGTRTRDAGEGALGAALGTLLGVLALGILTAIGFALGANAAGVDLARVVWPAGFYFRPGWGTMLGYYGTTGGIIYLVACLLAAAIAGSVAGSLARPYEQARVTTTRTTTRMPRV